jgi:hypothetical protein
MVKTAEFRPFFFEVIDDVVDEIVEGQLAVAPLKILKEVGLADLHKLVDGFRTVEFADIEFEDEICEHFLPEVDVGQLKV